ncbi:methylmalonyl-CoA mutase subunit beta [Micromonospora zamorensis]|uniref:methylmalonyl-CoA mutase subunit beta n=1 Tax=Micromonospora zamorensis TaxID=709883 RepID=UPI002E27BBC8|nr:methylmalonyl-CoA mutase subunit beta [Micromonospora zamorensis]
MTRDFPVPAIEDWQRLTLSVLRRSGRADENTAAGDAADLLATTTYDGFPLAPLYTSRDTTVPDGLPGQAPFTRGGGLGGRWDVRTVLTDPDPVRTAAAARADLHGGATSLWLRAAAPEQLGELLTGIPLDRTGIVLDAGTETDKATAALLDVAARQNIEPRVLRGNLGADPYGAFAATGIEPELGVAADLAAQSVTAHPELRALTVDVTTYHDAGGSDAEELGCALATGVAYLRAMSDRGIPLTRSLDQLEFRYAATADQFATIAKLRAARRLWHRVTEVAGANRQSAQRQHAVTSGAMMTARDPWSNLLRTTLACFGAGVGGAGAITVQPFDVALGRPDESAQRIARNTQLILLDEAHLHRVTDPAGGSWYVESRTDELARAAWEWFTTIERAGGIGTALRSGLVADRLAATWERRATRVARRQDAITGVSEFPDLDEQVPARHAVPPAPVGGLPRHRYAERFEELRRRADGATTAPVVHLVTIGRASDHGARVAFAANLFAAGGIRTVTTAADEPVPPGAVACVCSSDRLYAEQAASVTAVLRQAGAAKIWLAGRPGGQAGVDDHLYAGCDAVRVLETTLDDLGVPR